MTSNNSQSIFKRKEFNRVILFVSISLAMRPQPEHAPGAAVADTRCVHTPKSKPSTAPHCDKNFSIQQTQHNHNLAFTRKETSWPNDPQTHPRHQHSQPHGNDTAPSPTTTTPTACKNRSGGDLQHYLFATLLSSVFFTLFCSSLPLNYPVAPPKRNPGYTENSHPRPSRKPHILHRGRRSLLLQLGPLGAVATRMLNRSSAARSISA